MFVLARRAIVHEQLRARMHYALVHKRGTRGHILDRKCCKRARPPRRCAVRQASCGMRRPTRSHTQHPFQ
eukprot:6973271-Lingulodinium_polyedra.AAC.1